MTARYEIRVRGTLDAHARVVMQDLEPEALLEMHLTVLVGRFDQAQLHGVLERLRYLGLDVDDVRRVAPSASG